MKTRHCAVPEKSLIKLDPCRPFTSSVLKGNMDWWQSLFVAYLMTTANYRAEKGVGTAHLALVRSSVDP